MVFSDKDQTVERAVTERPMAVRIERNDSHVEDPPVDIYVVKEIDGHTATLKVPREAVVANWDGPEKTLKAWALAIIDAAK